MKHFNFIVIEGNIGAGKTTLSKKIAEKYNAKLVLEKFAENPFLPKFYQNPDKFAFQVETSFLIDRYWQLKNELQSKDIFSDFIVADYYFPKSLIFAKNNLKDDEYILFRRIFDIIYRNIPKPDLYIFLHLNTKQLLKNIKKRGRPYEKSITADYLKKIDKAYFDYFREESKIKFLILDTNNIDFVEQKKDLEKILHTIFNTEIKEGINFVKL